MINETKTCDCVCQGVGPAVTKAIGSMQPSEAGKHFRAARVEFLKGLRTMIDHRIEKLSRMPKQDAAGTAVPVD